MKSLYESLLDDFDAISGRQDEDTLAQALIKVDELAAKSTRHFKLSKNITFCGGEKPSDHSRVENGIFKCMGAPTYRYDKYVKQEMEKIKLLQPFDTIWVLNDFEITAHVIDKEIAETINMYNGGLTMHEVKEINGVTINSVINNSWLGSSFNASGPRNYQMVIKNSKITIPKEQNIGSCGMMSFVDIPEISNSRIEGYRMVKVYSPSVIRDRKDNKLTNMFDPTYKAYYHDTKLGALQDYTKKGDFKTVCAIVNNPKKYKFVETAEQKCAFRMNPSFKLKDVINIDCFDEELYNITIMDNNVAVIFTRTKQPKYGSTGGHGAALPWNTAKLPNDDWCVSVVKK